MSKALVEKEKNKALGGNKPCRVKEFSSTIVNLREIMVYQMHKNEILSIRNVFKVLKIKNLTEMKNFNGRVEDEVEENFLKSRAKRHRDRKWEREKNMN